MRMAPLPLLLLIACGEATAPVTPTPPVAPAPEAAPTPAPVAKKELPDLRQGLETGLCEKGPGNEGADSHFLGDIQINGSAVTGTETWVLGANEKWKKKGGDDCEMTWKLSGRTTTVGACADCDSAILLEATPNAGSNCVEDLIKIESRAFTETYDLKLAPDGNAWIYFHKSGKALGQGYHDGAGHLIYASIHQCKWF